MISYGIDIGTTTFRAVATQISIDLLGKRHSKLLGSPLCVFTPFLQDRSLDEAKLQEILDGWIKTNNLPCPELGTVLFTGEAQRAKNALKVGEILTSKWKGLLSAQLNPNLESRIAAFGSSAVGLSEKCLGQPVVHIDIGGGTSNFAWIENGDIVDTACLNIGCRKWILDPLSGRVLHSTKEGNYLAALAKTNPEKDSAVLCQLMARFLLEFSRGKISPELEPLVVIPWKHSKKTSTLPLISISGGVLECRKEVSLEYGDIGPLFIEVLEKAILANNGKVSFSPEFGRATALGAANFGFHLSGSSVHVDPGFTFPVKNVPVFTESSLKETALPTGLFALRLEDFGTDAETLRQKAEYWGHRFASFDSRRVSVLFLLPSNTGKSFGYFLSKHPTSFPKAVLDEVPFENCASGVQTLDVLPTDDNRRYFVVFKSLLLF